MAGTSQMRSQAWPAIPGDATRAKLSTTRPDNQDPRNIPTPSVKNAMSPCAAAAVPIPLPPTCSSSRADRHP